MKDYYRYNKTNVFSSISEVLKHYFLRTIHYLERILLLLFKYYTVNNSSIARGSNAFHFQ